MYESLLLSISYYLDFYYRMLYEQWQNMTPMKYGMLLSGIAFVGWLLMKSSMKR